MGAKVARFTVILLSSIRAKHDNTTLTVLKRSHFITTGFEGLPKFSLGFHVLYIVTKEE